MISLIFFILFLFSFPFLLHPFSFFIDFPNFLHLFLFVFFPFLLHPFSFSFFIPLINVLTSFSSFSCSLFFTFLCSPFFLITLDPTLFSPFLTFFFKRFPFFLHPLFFLFKRFPLFSPPFSF